MATRQGLLQLFIGLTAIAAIFIGIGACISHARLGDIAGRAVLLSPRFGIVVLCCGLLLYTARLVPRYALLCAAIAVCALIFSRLAPHWSDAWSNGRSLSTNLATALIGAGACAVFVWQRSSQRDRLRLTRGEIPVALLGLAASTFISFVLIEDNIRTRQAFADRSAEVVASNLGDRTVRAEMLIQRLTERWNTLQYMPERSFMEGAFTGYLRDFPFFPSIHLIDQQGSIVLEQRRDSLRLENLMTQAELEGLLGHARASRGTRIAIREDGETHKKIGLLVAPLVNPEMMNWSVIASVDPAHIATWAMTRVDGRGYFRISHRNNLLYQSADTPPANAIADGHITIPMHDDFEMNLYYAYSPAETDLGTEVWAEFLWLAGFIVTFLLIVSQRLTSVAQQRAVQLSHNALHDPLTGLPNRRQLERKLKEICAHARRDNQPVSVAFFNLDGIKLINDSAGHDIGDEVLTEVAQRLEQGAGVDAVVNQLGDNEFVLLFSGLFPDQVKMRSEALIEELSRPYQVADRALSLTANVGIASNDSSVDDPMELVRRADLAMLQAKRDGQNTWHTYTTSLSAEVTERLQLLHDLQLALDNDALELHYQPIVEGRFGRVVGAEGLLRWLHENHGYISPARFIPLVEETGQIVALTDWVLATACRDSAQLHEQGLSSFPVAVNISPVYFQRADFIEKVEDALKESRLPPQFLELEITEGVLVNNEKAAVAKLAQLQKMGIRTSIDDFGTGYSSLSYLKNLPIDKVKIDRSFITDVVNGPADAAIVQGIISMAHHLGLTVVAEGVETEPQFSFLKRHRCDAFQGFLFSQAKPFDELRAALEQSAGHLLPMPPPSEQSL